ncbi:MULTISPECIES: response regulator transcription factor [unclassified Methylophaga]|jgi:DNA-binding response OmpR family regulator|uniref:response regulator transcription factor n=1 Tax=unclassified Methylophaga TaxID=2629249 RepID=UPI00259CCCA3|nr:MULTISPECIES: response regulator transcription factor [unclassified Methylophaga]|tara:strand:- start:687 stop:1352 length:666 start_codon:yes stop_codon:yes gene_type:complete
MRLLLVEDDPSLGPNLQDSLNKAGFATDLSTDGIDGEAMGQIEPYDLIVLDLGLPGKSGLEVLENWRSQANSVPVIILTARDAWEDKVLGFKAGADDYLAKPFQTEELIVRINAVLRRCTGHNPGALSYGDLSLDEAEQAVIVKNGNKHSLTGTEFKLLRYFMLHPKQLLSKTTLTEHVYQLDSDKDSNVMEVYVNRLRQKIGADWIITRRGQGYIFGQQD